MSAIAAEAMTGAFVGLWLSLLAVVVILLHIYTQGSDKPRTEDHQLLLLGLVTTFGGLLADQSIWTLVNIWRSLTDESGFWIAFWVATHAPWVVVLSKFCVSLGVMILLYTEIRHRWPKVTLMRMVGVWWGVWAAYTLSAQCLDLFC